MTQIVELERVRRRLEAFLHALFDRRFTIAVTDPAPRISWWRRYVTRRLPVARASRAYPATDGTRIWLPRAIASRPDADGAAIYRVLALIQAEILIRRSPAEMAFLSSALDRDLFSIYESASAEYQIAHAHPGLAGTVRSLRLGEERAWSVWPAPSNALVVRLRDEVLAAAPRRWPTSLPPGLDAVGARAWARNAAAVHNARLYAPLRRVWHWGTILDPSRTRGEEQSVFPKAGMVFIPIGRSPQASAPTAGEELSQTSDGGASGDASDSGRATVTDSSAGGGAAEAWDQPSRDLPGLGPGSVLAARYHEWDYAVSRFDRDRVSVFESVVEESDADWATNAARTHRGLIRRVEREFQTLGAHRHRLTRQLDGDDLDLQASVDLRVALRARMAPDERVYTATRPPRGGVALAILADVSGSAETTLEAGVRIIDVEKLALLVATHALETTGDRHALFAFSSMGAPRVAVRTAKSFGERGGAVVGSRIAALESAGNTRLGAAIRHTSAMLLRERAARHLMLVISDGLPNDSDGYVEDHGIEDARMAVLEARAHGVMPHCLTLSAEEHYALRIFGAPAQVLVRKPEHLPTAMLDVLGRLLRR